MPDTMLAGVRRTTLREQALASLQAGILDGTLPPGTRLGEAELAEQLGVSRGTVREALRYLQQSGLVEGAERTGLSVRTVSALEVTELFEVRAALESLAVRRIIRHPERASIVSRVRALFPEFTDEQSLSERLAVDLAFHEGIVRESGNAMLLQAWLELKNLMHVAVLVAKPRNDDASLSRSYHEPIMDALADGTEDEAVRVIFDHMQRAAQRWARNPS